MADDYGDYGGDGDDPYGGADYGESKGDYGGESLRVRNACAVLRVCE